MNAIEIAEAIEDALLDNVTLYIRGESGIGKSDVTRQTLTQAGYQLFNELGLSTDVRTSQLEPVDAKGIPVPKDGRTHWFPAAFLPTGNEPKPVAMFLDEMSDCPLPVQAALYQLILDGQLGDYKLPASTRIIAAGNLDNEGAIIQKMKVPLRKRMRHAIMTFDRFAWEKWALAHGIDIRMVAFHRFTVGRLLHVPSKTEYAQPSPRAWEFLNRAVLRNPAPNRLLRISQQTVGEGAAAEFCGFMRVCNTLPSLDGIISNPMGANVPTEPSTQFAIAVGLAKRANDSNIGNIIKYADRLSADCSIVCVMSALKQDDAIANTRAYIQWQSDHSDVMV